MTLYQFQCILPFLIMFGIGGAAYAYPIWHSSIKNTESAGNS